jgi:hypothetical protein
MWKDRRIYVSTAWASLLAGVLISSVFWLWIVHHEGRRGERPSGALLFYIVLLLASVLSGLAGILGLFGIRSGRDALLILPGGLSGIAINGYNIVMCLLAYALEGGNLGG